MSQSPHPPPSPKATEQPTPYELSPFTPTLLTTTDDTLRPLSASDLLTPPRSSLATAYRQMYTGTLLGYATRGCEDLELLLELHRREGASAWFREERGTRERKLEGDRRAKAYRRGGVFVRRWEEWLRMQRRWEAERSEREEREDRESARLLAEYDAKWSVVT